MTHDPHEREQAPLVHVTITGDAELPEAILLERPVTRIGRDPQNDIVLRNRFVSTAHAEIVRADGRALLRDLRSTNGSRIRRNRWIVNVDHRCDHEAVLEDGDEILLGEETHPVCLRVTIAAPVAPDGPVGVTIVQAVQPGEVHDAARRMDRDALLLLQDLAASIQPRDEPAAVASAFASWILKYFPKASHVSVCLADPATGTFTSVASLGPDGDTIPGTVSRTLQAEVMRTGTSVAFAGEASTSLHDASIKEGLCAPLFMDGRVVGLVQADRRTGSEGISFRKPEVELLAVAARQASLAIELSHIRATHRGTVEDAVVHLIAVTEQRDAYMAGHAVAVAQLAGRLAARLRLPAEEIARVQRAGALHDVGRFSVPLEVLNAPGQLTPAQFARIRAAPIVGSEILRRFSCSPDLVDIIRHVHERWDGTGYPDGLAGDAIPLASRIVAVADAFHTLVSHRAHQPAMTQTAALAEIAATIGSRFDARVVGALEVTIMSSDETWEFGVATSIGLDHELVGKSK